MDGIPPSTAGHSMSYTVKLLCMVVHMLYGGVDMVRCCAGYLCGTVQSKIPQFDVADIFSVQLCKARYHNLAQWNCRLLP